MSNDKIDTTNGMRRVSALEALRKQAEGRAKQEDPAVVRARTIEALNKEMRSVASYISQVGGEISQVKPEAGQPFEILFLGKFPVSLADAWVDSRPTKVDGLDCMTTINVRYRMNAVTPAKVTLLGDDIARLEQLLKPLSCDYKMTVEQKNDFGQARRASFVLNGKINSQLEFVADYTNFAVSIELINVRKYGTRRHRVPADKFKDAGDDLARYILGVDDEFERFFKT
jgi:hypothetical protein